LSGKEAGDSEMRHARQSITGRPAPSERVASRREILRPGRTVFASTETSPTGIGPRISKARRAKFPPASDSRARPRSAAAGPPCCEPEPHRVAVSSVARKPSSPFRSGRVMYL
jgi:hypothetical protein